MTKRSGTILMALVIAVPALAQAQVGWILSGNDLLNTNSGNVGIGTSSPTVKLHVEGLTRNNGLHLYTVQNPAKRVFLGFNDGPNPYTFISSWDSAAGLQPIWLSASMVGVGKNPTRMLDVNGDIGGLEGFLVNYPATKVYDNATSNSPYSRVNADSLHTNGLGVGQLFLEGRAIDSNTIIYIGAGVAGGQAAHDVRLGNNNEVFVDTSLNNVGIGTSTPNAAYKLAVNGIIAATEIRVTQANLPDYVFEDSYPLRSLEEVEAAIRRQGHLPGFPSAAQAATEGVGIGEMQSLLLEKIEELTLYVIDLKKDNDALRARLDSLEVSP